MKRIEAIEKATKIAGLIREGVNRIKYDTAMKDLPLLAMLPLLALGEDLKSSKDVDFNSLCPKVFEVLIFGSVAREDSEDVGDIDIMVLDNGFFSKFFSCKHKDDWYLGLSENLHLLLTGWLGYSDDELLDVLDGVDTDLHVLPLEMLKSENLRKKIALKHRDPLFLQNAFSSMLVHDRVSHELNPSSIGYLEGKYKTDLADIKG